MADVIPVLLYHGVPRSSPQDRLAVPYELFREHVAAIRACGRVALTIGELAAGLRGDSWLPARAVAVTFDDGHKSSQKAIELLSDHGLKTTAYVTTGAIDTPEMFSHLQLKALAERAGTVEIGAHSVTHPHLDELSRAKIDSEVRESKCELEQLLGAEVNSFAYPYGAYDRRVREAVIGAGFSSAAAVKNALSHTADDNWAIARWTVRATTSAWQLERVLEGAGVPTAWQRERVRTRAYRAARRLRRTVAPHYAEGTL